MQKKKFGGRLTPLAAVAPAFLLVSACSGDGPQAGELSLSQASYTVDESAGTITISVLRTGKNLTEAGVDYTVTAGTAGASDFTAVSGTLNWAVGDNAFKSFTVPIAEDVAIEGNETFTVTLGNVRLADLKAPSTAQVTIVENDRLGDSFATSGNTLFTFDRAAPGSVLSQATLGVPAGETVLGVDVRPATNELYALTDAGKLYVIDPATGAATLKSTLVADPTDSTSPFSGVGSGTFGVDFNPVPDRLRVVSDAGLNLRINVDSGVTITDGAINGAATGYGAAAYTNNFAAACRTALYTIDPVTDRLLLQNPPNDGTAVVVGSLGVDVGAVNGFDIITSSSGANTALAALTVNGTPRLYSINLSSGAATALAAFSSTSVISGLSFPVTSDARSQAAGDTIGLTESGKLVTFNRAAPAKLCTSAALSGLGSGENVVGIDTRPADGQLYALTSASKLYTVDKTTAAATLKSTLSTALAGSAFGVDFNPVPDRLRVVSDTGQNLRINVDTGATTVDGGLTVGGSTRGVSATAYTNSLKGGNAATLSTTIFYLDTANDRLLTAADPNAGAMSEIGALGVDISEVNGFDINGSDNTALIAVNAAGTPTTTLHTLNLSTGAASASLGTVGGGERLVGLTPFAAPASATVFGLNTAGELVSFVPSAPATVTTIGPVSGLQGGETVLGIDFRPSTGKLYALTSAGRLYTVDPATAVATPASTLAADASDMSSPFTGIGSDTAYGLDFNPTGPVALRVVSNSGQNLRIGNPDAGNTFTDAPLAYGPFAVTAAAYTNSFAGTATTQLFVIDTTSDRVFLQSPPNDGVLKDRGLLGVDADAVNGFDIVGASDAYAVLTVGGMAGLYKVDVASAFSTARATRIGGIGATGSIKGLAIPTTMTAPATPTLFALIGTSGADVLASFPADAPGSVSTIGNVTGLGMGEQLVGIDFRPATGVLYGLTQNGKLYTIDTTTAIALPASTLTADAGDLTAPFTALAGTSFGVDFNPVPDRLRVVSSAGENLRINVASGATITDTALTRPPQIAAAAYTNSFAGSTATQLYVFDANSAGLSLQAPPNDGVLTSVNPVGLNLTDLTAVSFDIAGGGNGFALAALQADGATQSSLYRINLATGQATLAGAIGGAGTSPLRSLAIQVK